MPGAFSPCPRVPGHGPCCPSGAPHDRLARRRRDQPHQGRDRRRPVLRRGRRRRADGDAGNDTLDGGTGDDALWGDAGDDELTGGAGGDQLHGGDGQDSIFYSGAGVEIVIGGYSHGGDADGDTVYSDIENVYATDSNDYIIGSAVYNVLVGNAGNDFLSGLDGNDTLIGYADNDIIQGGNGNDWIDGGTGDDILRGETGGDIMIGGDGNDRIEYSSSDAGVNIDPGGRHRLWRTRGGRLFLRHRGHLRFALRRHPDRQRRLRQVLGQHR
jgi:Ca2+-binding RTX toxin-like protein